MRNQLRAVDGEARTVAVRDRRQPSQRQGLPGDVARAGDREQGGGAGGEFRIHPFQRLLDGVRRLDDPRAFAFTQGSRLA